MAVPRADRIEPNSDSEGCTPSTVSWTRTTTTSLSTAGGGAEGEGLGAEDGAASELIDVKGEGLGGTNGA